MCVDYDPPDVWREERRRAAKQHRCDECRRTIEVGEHYQVTAGLSLDTGPHWYGAKTCEQCVEATRWLLDVCSGYLLGDVMDELAEHIYEPPPISSVSLARLVSRMRRRWAHHGGRWSAEDVRALVALALEPYHQKVA